MFHYENANEAYRYLCLQNSVLLKTGKGQLGGFFVSSASGAATMTVYDNTSAAGIKIIDTVLLVEGTPIPVPAEFSTGCYVEITGTCSLTAFFV